MISDESISQRAHYLWETSGRPEGQSERFWHEAKQQIEQEQKTLWEYNHSYEEMAIEDGYSPRKKRK